LIGQLLISFREALEAALITAIVLGYLSRTGRKLLSRYVWQGVLLAVSSSLVVGAIIWLSYGAIPRTAQVLFEGMAALLAVAVLTSMILWMATKAVKIKEEVEQRVEAIVSRGAIFGLVSFSFIIVFREGLETVLFLTPPLIADAIPRLRAQS
jgi:high-affinity iron transporter